MKTLRMQSNRSSLEVPRKESITTTEEEVQKQTMIEKYLQVADFVECITQCPELFVPMGSDLGNNKEVLHKFLIEFMVKLQNSLNYEKISKTLILNDLHSVIIDELFNQTDRSIKRNEPEYDRFGNANESTSSIMASNKVKLED